MPRVDISEHQMKGSVIAGQNRTARKEALQLVKSGELTIEELIDACVFSPAYHTIKLKQVFEALKVEPAIRLEIYEETGLKEDRKLGTLTSEKAANKKEALLKSLKRNYHPDDGWPWRHTF